MCLKTRGNRILLWFFSIFFFPARQYFNFFHRMFKVYSVPSVDSCQCGYSTDLPLGKGINEAYPLFLNHLSQCKLCFTEVLSSLCIISTLVHVNSVFSLFRDCIATCPKLTSVDWRGRTCIWLVSIAWLRSWESALFNLPWCNPFVPSSSRSSWLHSCHRLAGCSCAVWSGQPCGLHRWQGCPRSLPGLSQQRQQHGSTFCKKHP